MVLREVRYSGYVPRAVVCWMVMLLGVVTQVEVSIPTDTR